MVSDGFEGFRSWGVRRSLEDEVRKSCGAKVLPTWGCVLRLAVLRGGYVHVGKKNWQMSIQRLAHMFRLTWCVLARCLFSFGFVWRRGCRCPADGLLARHCCHATGPRCSAPSRRSLFLRSRVSACLLGQLVLCWHVCRFGGPTSFERQPLDCCATDTPAKLWRISLALW